MSIHLEMMALVVADYDEAIAWYSEKLGFELVEDTALSPEKRWVVMAPSRASGARILLAKAKGPEQAARIGDQTGGRVFLFLHTTDFDVTYAAYRAAGVPFIEEPRHESYGRVCVFEDLYGNRWDLVERRDDQNP